MSREASAAAAVRTAHEEVRRGIAAASTRLEGRQQRIAAFSATRVEAQQRMSDAVASARSEFESLLPKDEGGVLVEAERARLAAHAASRDAALAHEDRRKQLASLSPEKAKGATADDSVVSMATWFYAPAHRTGLAHTPKWRGRPPPAPSLEISL